MADNSMRDVELYEERADDTRMDVVHFDGDREGTGQAGETRPAGIVARGVPNMRAPMQATFRGESALRKGKSR